MNLYKYASPMSFYPLAGKMIPWFAIPAGILFIVGLYVGFFVAPTDAQQGDAYRIIFIHVPAAWMGMFLYVLMAIYAGIGSRAQLITLDRESGETTNVLPAAFANRTFVATLALEGDRPGSLGEARGGSNGVGELSGHPIHDVIHSGTSSPPPELGHRGRLPDMSYPERAAETERQKYAY